MSLCFKSLLVVVVVFAAVQHLCLVSAFTQQGQQSFTSPATSVNRGTPLFLSKGPLDTIKNFLESTSASVTDYILMQPKRDIPPGFRRVQTQFIAALGDPNASFGKGAEQWGIWRIDPGPRGVYLADYNSLEARNGRAPAGWTFDKSEWWLEEYGRIMEPPDFPLPAGRYVVTGGRQVTTILTVDKPDASGNQNWKLESGKLYDVTHLPCRSAVYRANKGNGSPATANLGDFPVTPGAEMPAIRGCDKQDYAVLFIIAVEND